MPAVVFAARGQVVARGTGDTARPPSQELCTQRVDGNGAVCCLAGCNLSELSEGSELRALALRLMHETRSIAAAHGVPALADPEQILPRELPSFKPSMQKDLEAGRETEFDAIYLATVDFARAAGVPTPVLDVIVPLLKRRTAVYTPKS